jgi:hypothetical protein
LENKNIEKIDLSRKLLNIKKVNGITSIGFHKMKESLIKNKILKEICLDFDFIDQKFNFDNDFHLVYKLLNFTKNGFDLNFSNNIYLLSDNIILKLNYLKCFIDVIDHLFFNFNHFDFIFIFF